jgi:hypothetical protein
MCRTKTRLGTRSNGARRLVEEREPDSTFPETLRRVAMIDEGFAEDEAGARVWSGWDIRPGSQDCGAVSGTSIGGHSSSAVSLQWSANPAMAAGATGDEIANVLVAITPVAGLSRLAATAPGLAIALGYDVAAALEERTR